MELAINDTEKYRFNIGKGLGDILFGFTEKQVVEILGLPPEYEYDIIQNGEAGDISPDDDFFINEEKIFLYEDLKISFIYFDCVYHGLTIQTDYKLIINGINIFDKNNEEIFGLLEEIYKEKSLTFGFEKSIFEELENHEEIDFPAIGLSLFFEENKLINVTIEKPME